MRTCYPSFIIFACHFNLINLIHSLQQKIRSFKLKVRVRGRFKLNLNRQVETIFVVSEGKYYRRLSLFLNKILQLILFSSSAFMKPFHVSWERRWSVHLGTALTASAFVCHDSMCCVFGCFSISSSSSCSRDLQPVRWSPLITWRSLLLTPSQEKPCQVFLSLSCLVFAASQSPSHLIRNPIPPCSALACVHVRDDMRC